MPDPFNKAKMTGDTHPPEVESDLPLEEESSHAAGIGGTPGGRGKAVERGDVDRPGRAVKKAVLFKNRDGTPGGDEGTAAGSDRDADGDQA